MKCAILAAGCSTRLRPYTDDLPKTLLPVGGVPILRRTIASFMRLGVEQFVIGTGYLEHKVRAAVAEWFPGLDVAFVTNPDYASTNNAYSLLLLREHLEGEVFALIDGDVVFDLGVIKQLMVLGLDCLAVRSAGGIGLEEVKVTLDQSGHVRDIGKHVPIAAALHERVRERGLVNEYYEAAFQQVIREGVALRGVDIGARYAAEIDTYDDLREADLYLSALPRFDVGLPAVRAAV